MNVLFICSRNQWRSPTAEQIYRNDPRMKVRSAGTSPKARRRLTQQDLNWADLVLVMERKHGKIIRLHFASESLPPIQCLDIPDDYQYMDEELISLLRASVESLLEK